MWHITREQADEFAARSQRRAGDAQANGRFDREIAPVVVGANGDGRVISQDQGIRPDTTAESLAVSAAGVQAGRHPARRQQLADHRRRRRRAPDVPGTGGRARDHATCPDRRADGGRRRPGDHAHRTDPGDDAAPRAIRSKIDDIDLFEVNEAFAPVVLAWEQEHHPDMERVNVNGGAIALGHPLGASGARLMTTLLHELERRDGRYGLQAMCCGGGLGTGTLIDRSI